MRKFKIKSFATSDVLTITRKEFQEIKKDFEDGHDEVEYEIKRV